MNSDCVADRWKTPEWPRCASVAQHYIRSQSQKLLSKAQKWDKEQEWMKQRVCARVYERERFFFSSPALHRNLTKSVFSSPWQHTLQVTQTRAWRALQHELRADSTRCTAQYACQRVYQTRQADGRDLNYSADRQTVIVCKPDAKWIREPCSRLNL